MPQKNTIKEYIPNSYYHIYTRGANKQKIFLEPADYNYFLALFERYLSGNKVFSKTGVVYPDYSKEIKLLSYCLMPNHIHIMLFQYDNPREIRKFMSSLMTSYSKYFNLKYKRLGSVFESRYKAKRIDNDSYLIHLSRYIHMNPRRWRGYKYSSLRYVFDPKVPRWLYLSEILDGFNDSDEYIKFLLDYQENKDQLEIIKAQLADSDRK